MAKTLTKVGNSWAVVIDRGMMELLHIDETTPLEFSTDGDVLVIAPVRDKKRRKAFEAALEKTLRRHSRVFKRLAQT